jgi:hypothetical protein
MILFDQFLDVGEYQDAPKGDFCQVRNNQALAGTRRQNDDCGVSSFSEVIERAINCFLLVGPELIHSVNKLFDRPFEV